MYLNGLSPAPLPLGHGPKPLTPPPARGGPLLFDFTVHGHFHNGLVRRRSYSPHIFTTARQIRNSPDVRKLRAICTFGTSSIFAHMILANQRLAFRRFTFRVVGLAFIVRSAWCLPIFYSDIVRRITMHGRPLEWSK